MLQYTPPIGHAAHVRFKDMRRGFETNFCHKKKSAPRPKGGKLKHICAMVLLQDFVTFWGRNITVNKLNPYDFKEENEKTFFVWKNM